jgi:hypothetical protein
MKDRELADKIHERLKQDDLAGAELLARRWQKEWPRIAERALAACERISRGGGISPDEPAPERTKRPPQPLVRGSRGPAYYRIAFPETSKFRGRTVTFRVKSYPEDSSFAAGKTVLAYHLDSVEDWEQGRFKGCAFVTESGYATLWKRFQHKNSQATQGFYLLIADPLEAAVAYGKAEVRCAVCRTPLENEESRELGIGPICRQKFGG